MDPFFLLLFVTLFLIFIQGAFSFSNFFFHRVLQNISLFLWGRDSLKMISNIIICIVIFKAIVKYSKTLRFVRGIISIFKRRSNFIGTLKNNKFFYLLCIIKFIVSLSIRGYGFIIIVLTLERKVFMPHKATRFIPAKTNIIYLAQVPSI